MRNEYWFGRGYQAWAWRSAIEDALELCVVDRCTGKRFASRVSGLRLISHKQPLLDEMARGVEALWDAEFDPAKWTAGQLERHPVHKWGH